jgi:hypothetical protein
MHPADIPTQSSRRDILCHSMSHGTVSKRRPDASQLLPQATRSTGPVDIRAAVPHVENVDRATGRTGFSQHRHALTRYNETISEGQESQKGIVATVWPPLEKIVLPGERLA